jgi:hypothetical protein
MVRTLSLGALFAATASAILITPAVDIADDGPVFRITIPPQFHNPPSPFSALSPVRHAVPKEIFPETPKVADKGIWKTFLLPIKGSHESLVS